MSDFGFPTHRKIKMGDMRLTSDEILAVMEVAISGQLSPAKKVKEFEQKFAERHGCKAGIMVNSGTDALRIALAALKERHGWRDGDVVLVPSVTFVATVNIVLQLGLKPVPVDVSLDDYNMDPAKLESEIQHSKEKPVALIVVHLCGQLADMQEIMRIAEEYGLFVIEDACETAGIGMGEDSVGSFGDVGCFSFYACHLLVTGVGGIAVTKDEELEKLMRSYANHGRSISYIPGYADSGFIQERFKFERIGYSARATEFEAAIGLLQLETLESNIASRRANATSLINLLSKYPLKLPIPVREHGFMMFPIMTKDHDKWELCKHLEKYGIETREILPLIDQPCYKNLWNPNDYPNAKLIGEKGFYIGCHPFLTQADLEHIDSAFASFPWPK